MDLALLGSLIGFAAIASITPGPNNLLLMSSGALFGLRRTVPHLIGIQCGFGVVVTAAVFGLGTLVARWPWLVTIARVLGAGWLAWMSLRFFRTALRNGETERSMDAVPISRPFRFFEAILFQWVNPKVLVAAISCSGAYIAIADEAWLRAAIMASVFFTVGGTSCTIWTIAGDSLNRYMSSGKSASWVNAAMGLLILLTAGHILMG